ARFNGGGVSMCPLDLSNGKLRVPASAPVSTRGAVAVAVHSTQKFVFVAGENHHVDTYRINADGSLPTLPTTTAAIPENIQTMALDPTGRFLYVASSQTFSPPSPRLIYTFRVDPDTG